MGGRIRATSSHSAPTGPRSRARKRRRKSATVAAAAGHPRGHGRDHVTVTDVVAVAAAAGQNFRAAHGRGQAVMTRRGRAAAPRDQDPGMKRLFLFIPNIKNIHYTVHKIIIYSKN